MKLRDVVVFLSGAEFFHTLGHVMMAYFAPLPIPFKFMVLTAKVNMWAIVVNGLITILLLLWAKSLSEKKK